MPDARTPHPSLDPARSVLPGRVQGQVAAPGSKSHAMRLLLAAALASGRSTITGVPLADDVRALVDSLRRLGFELTPARSAPSSAPQTLTVRGTAGKLPVAGAELDLGGSGTAWRFMAALCALGPGPYRLGGDRSLLGRPFGSLARSLGELGAVVAGGGGDGAALTIAGGPVGGGRTVAVDASRSSHPVSALMLLAPHLPGGLTLRLGDEVVSRPYIDLTAEVLRTFGAEVGGAEVDTDEHTIRVPACVLRPLDAAVEGDWSSAAFLLAAAAVSGGEVTVTGTRAASSQADRRIVDLLRLYGADVEQTAHEVMVRGRDRRPLDVDLGSTPDLAPVVAALGCAVDGSPTDAPTIVRGAPHLRIKESDRIAACVGMARALGCHAVERDDGFEIHGRSGASGEHPLGPVDPHGDHRIAMAAAVVGLVRPGTAVADPGCVAKSYPAFWDDLSRLTIGT